jgi:NAD(P)-dependent dehydrogenase (short-subunit alcohol dehydrogenase family)
VSPNLDMLNSNADDRRIALVTGANRGIGLEVVRQLATRGAVVWLGSRDIGRGLEAAERLAERGLDVRAVQLSVSDEDSIRHAAGHVGEEMGRLDILINNAGIALGAGTPPSAQDVEQIKAMFETNVIGAIRTTQGFLPLLYRSAAGRIVMVSSDMGSATNQSNPDFPHYGINPLGYAASKSALNAVTIAFAKELRGSAIKVNAANPGFTATDLNEYRGELSVEQGAGPIVDLATLSDDGPTGTFVGPRGLEPW